MKIFRRNKYDLYQILRENESIDVEVTNNAIVVNPENRDEVNDLVFLLSLMTVGSKDEISFDINDVAELEKNLLSKQMNESNIYAVSADGNVISSESIMNLIDLQIAKNIYAPLITSAGGLNTSTRQRIADFIMSANQNNEYKTWCAAQSFPVQINIMSMLYYLKTETELGSDPNFVTVMEGIRRATFEGGDLKVSTYKTIVESFEKEGKSEAEKDVIASESLADFISEEFSIQPAIATTAANKIINVSKQLGGSRGKKVITWFKTVFPLIIKASKGFDANHIKEFFEVIDSVSLKQIMNSGGILQLPITWKFVTLVEDTETSLDKYASGTGMSTQIGRGEIPLALIVKDSNAEGVGADVSLKGPSGFMVDVHVKSHTGLYEVGDDLTKESSGSSKGPDKSAKFWQFALPFVINQYAGTLSGEDKTKLVKAIKSAEAGTTIINIIESTSADLEVRREYVKIFEAANRIMLKFHGPTGKSGILKKENALESVQTAMAISNETYSASLKKNGNLELKAISDDGLCLSTESKKNERLVYVDLDDNRSLMKTVDEAGVLAGTFTAKDLTDQIIAANPEKGHILLLNNKPNHGEVNQILDAIKSLVPKFSTQVEELRSLVLEPSPSTNMTNQFTQAIIGNALQNLAKLAPPDILITQDDFASLQNAAGNPKNTYSLRRALLDDPTTAQSDLDDEQEVETTWLTSAESKKAKDMGFEYEKFNYTVNKKPDPNQVPKSVLWHGKSESDLLEPLYIRHRDALLQKLEADLEYNEYLDATIKNQPSAQFVWDAIKNKIKDAAIAHAQADEEEQTIYASASEQDKRDPNKWTYTSKSSAIEAKKIYDDQQTAKSNWNGAPLEDRQDPSKWENDRVQWDSEDGKKLSNKDRAIEARFLLAKTAWENATSEQQRDTAKWVEDTFSWKGESETDKASSNKKRSERAAKAHQDAEEEIAKAKRAEAAAAAKAAKQAAKDRSVAWKDNGWSPVNSGTKEDKKGRRFVTDKKTSQRWWTDDPKAKKPTLADHKKYKLTNILAENCESMILGDPIEQSGRMLDYGRVKSDSEEARMTKAKLFRMAQNSQSLHDRLMDDDDLPEWVQDKITTAEDRLQVAYDYIEYKLHRMKTDGVKLTEARKRRLIKNMLKVI